MGVDAYPPGEYNLTVSVRDENGQTTTVVEPVSLSGVFVAGLATVSGCCDSCC